jgi:hypothetical protein
MARQPQRFRDVMSKIELTISGAFRRRGHEATLVDSQIATTFDVRAFEASRRSNVHHEQPPKEAKLD